ncbi:hypothetical protein GFH30_04155 [Acinetobacter wanghuae]|uniref:Uncharacterized protein n=1 Tax=Acinetobacter wanghuae TaxID=2662362 RepID=A0ABX6CYL6_9GAMM|nr:hypothetical protein [Acinetobacter wanghuae]QGA10641.1 hypothetical protein GFH30_04155 [Acinetobacter wanghuae]
MQVAADTLVKVVEDAVKAEQVEDAAADKLAAEEAQALAEAKAALTDAIAKADAALTSELPRLDGAEREAVIAEKAKAEAALDNASLTADELQVAADTLVKVVEDAVKAEQVEDAAEAAAAADKLAAEEAQALAEAKAALTDAIAKADAALTSELPRLDGTEREAVLVEKAKAEAALDNASLTADELQVAADTLVKVVEDAVKAEQVEDAAADKLAAEEAQALAEAKH